MGGRPLEFCIILEELAEYGCMVRYIRSNPNNSSNCSASFGVCSWLIALIHPGSGLTPWELNSRRKKRIFYFLRSKERERNKNAKGSCSPGCWQAHWYVSTECRSTHERRLASRQDAGDTDIAVQKLSSSGRSRHPWECVWRKGWCGSSQERMSAG